jgi:hypothetical protein
MISLFSKLMDYTVASQFRRDPSGRLVFVPESVKGKCYFVDSKSDEGKIRAFVKMYRSVIQLISWLTFPSIFLPAVILDHDAGLTPRYHRLAIAFGIPMIFLLVLVALMVVLWALYQQALPRFTSSLSEVGSDLEGQLKSEMSPEQRRLAVASFIACEVGLLTLLIGALLAWNYSH